MKKIKAIVVSLVALTLLLSACGTATSEPTVTPEAPAVQPSPVASGTPNGVSVESAPEEPTPLPVQVEVGSVTISLPEGWVYEERPEDGQGWTLAFGPEEDTRRVLLRDFNGGFGVCGTGLTEVDLMLQNGDTARVGYYDGSDRWSFVSFGDGWVALNDEAPEWSEQALEALTTVTFSHS